MSIQRRHAMTKKISLTIFLILFACEAAFGAVQVIKFPAPKLYLSLVSGGSLAASTTYYFMGFFIRGGGYYGQACSPASEQYSIATDTTNKSIKVEVWQDGGDVTGYADAGGGQVTVTATAHGRSNSDTVWIRGTTNYDGSYTISNVTANSFQITDTWVANDGASKWFADQGKPTEAHNTHFKWDTYSMIDGSDSTPWQWCNENDPAVGAGNEFSSDVSYGHRKWTHRYYDTTTAATGNSVTFTSVSSTSSSPTPVAGTLYEGTSGSSFSSRSQHPGIAYKDTSSYYAIDDYFPRNQGRLLILLDNNSANTEDTLIDALEASGYDDMFILSHLNNDYGAWDSNCTITALAHMDIESGGTNTINDTNLILLGGGLGYSGSSNYITYNRCSLLSVTMGDSFWLHPPGTFNDCTLTGLSGTVVLDAATFDNTTIRGPLTWYGQTPSGANLVGGYGGASTYFQWRYPNSGSSDGHLQNFYINDFYCYMAMGGGQPVDTFQMTNVEFVNNGLENYDAAVHYSYLDDQDCNFTFNCTNVTSDRADSKIRVYHGTTGDPSSITEIWNMQFNIALKVVDESNTAISGASVSLTWSGGSDSDTTDASGDAEVTGLSYTVEYDSGDTDGYGYYTNTSALKELTLTITKSGYNTYEGVFTIDENKDWTIRLKAETVGPDVDGSAIFYDSTLYDATIY